MEKIVSNICRPFVLCNDFIPPTSNKDYKWRYLSLGYFDGIHIGPNLFEENKVSLCKLDNFYQKQSNELNGSYSTQIVYGVRTETTEEKDYGQIRDFDFWENIDFEQKFPYIFITLVQANKDINFLSTAWNKQTEFEKSLNEVGADKYKAITYLSLDNSDMILAIRSQSYSIGAKNIDEIHRNPRYLLNRCFDWNTKYTFTVASISKDYVYNSSSNSFNNENIDTAYIYMIEKNVGSVDIVYNELVKILKRTGVPEDRIRKKQSVMGYNDEVVELNNIPWNVFLRLYRNGSSPDGILNHSNEIYKNNLNGVTTIIGLDQKSLTDNLSKKPNYDLVQEDNFQDKPLYDMSPKIESAHYNTEHNNSIESQSLCSIMKIKCDKILSYMSEQQSVKNLKRNLYQIINSLRKFEETPFSDYLFLPTALPLNMVLDMALELESEEYAYMKKIIDAEEILGYFYEFIKGLNMYVQNSIRSDRQFIQIPEFNIKIYDIPTKITAFYNAYMFNLKNYLNKMVTYDNGNGTHEYEFLLCPGAANDLHIKEFFKKVSETKRLFLVESPESILFNPVIMLVILTHELGHVVGTGIRIRKKRTDYAIILMCKLTCRYLKTSIMQFLKGDTDIEKSDFCHNEVWSYINNETFWEKLEQTLYSELSEYLAENQALKDNLFYRNKEYFEFLTKYRASRKDHSYVVEAELTVGISNILENKNELLWGYLLEKVYVYWLGKNPSIAVNKKENLRSAINQLIADMRSSHSVWGKLVAFSLGNSIQTVYNVFQECLADLICILTLRLTIDDYVNTILWNAKYLSIVPVPGTEIHLRCCLVTFCMRYQDSKFDKFSYETYRWKDEDLKLLIGENKRFMDGIRKTLEIYLLNNGEPKKESTQEIYTALGMLYDSFIMENMVAYLLTCIREFFNYNNSPEMQKEQKELQETFRQFQESNVKELAVNMQVYIEKHLDALKKKHDKVIQDEGDYYAESNRC